MRCWKIVTPVASRMRASTVTPHKVPFGTHTRATRIGTRADRHLKPVPAVAEGPILIDGQVAHSSTKESLEVMQSMGDFMENNVGSSATSPPSSFE